MFGGQWRNWDLCRGYDEFNALEQSAIREISNIGLGNAMTALSNMTGRSFNMTVPQVSPVMLEDLPDAVGAGEDPVVAIFMEIEGDVCGYLAFLFTWESATKLWDMLLGAHPESIESVDELAASAILELGNIVNSSFMNAISTMTGLKVHATPPLVAINDCYSVVTSIASQAAMSETMALSIETQIYDMEEKGTSGFFLCIPTDPSLQCIFDRLGIKESA